LQFNKNFKANIHIVSEVFNIEAKLYSICQILLHYIFYKLY